MRHTVLLAALLLTACDQGDLKLDDTAEPDTTTGATDTDTDTDTDDDPTDDPTDDSTDTEDTGSPTSELILTLPDGAVIDPSLDGDPTLRIELTTAAPCDLTLQIDGEIIAEAAAATTLGLDWDGRADLDLFPPAFVTGLFPLYAEADCGDGDIATAGGQLAVIDLHIAALNFTGIAEATDGHVPLAFHKLDPDTPGITVLSEDLPEYWSLDPADPPGTWDDAHIPPWFIDEEPLDNSHNLPAAYVAGALPRAVLRPGELPEGAPALRILADGEGLQWEDSHDFLTDDDILLTGVTSLPATLGRQDLATTWRFEAEGPDGDWAPIPGSLETTHRLYLVADATALLDGTDIGAAPDVPWISVLEEIDAAVSGVPAETADVLDALREFIYTNPDYVYNPGDRAYSTYEGDYAYWDWIAFEMTDWLDHNDGVDMYCHSTSCMLSVLAATVGIDAPQYVIGHNFSTNLLLPAGSSDWDSFGFYSHSVASPDGGATIWDAAVMVDDDGDPSRYPVTAAPVNGVLMEDYFFGLTLNDVDFVHTTACYIQ